MYERIKRLADEAIALQNKNRMDEVLREISAVCDTLAEMRAVNAVGLPVVDLQPAAMDAESFEAAVLRQHRSAREVADAIGDDCEMVTYGTAKTYDSEAEMIADIQGRPSPVFPLTPEQQVRHEARQAAKIHSITGGFGMARLKKEGAALHPDDIDAGMTLEQRIKQIAAYERDTGDVLSTEARRSIDAAYEELKAEQKAEEAFGLDAIKKKGAAK